MTGSATRTYENDFRVSVQSVNGGSTATFSYDADSLLTGAGAQTITRSAHTGLVSGTTLGGVSDVWAYDSFGQPSSYTASYSANTLLAETYTRDALGRIIEKTETIQGVTHTYAYNYDLAGRLTDVYQNGNGISHHDYDANGNRSGGFTAGQGATQTATYDNQDRLLAYATTLGGALSYTYTGNGELLTRTDASGTTQYSYDVLGNLRSVTLPDLTLIEYLVDGKNRRIGKVMNGVLMQGWLYEDELRPVAELDGTSTVVTRFVYGERLNVPEYMVNGGVTYRLITDHLGSPRLVVNVADGTVAQRIDYDEFGDVLIDTNPGFQPFGFAGGLYDSGTKLLRFGARDYDVETGRWTAKDPIRFAGKDTNLYGYVLNDPINLVDPFGLYGTNDCSYYEQKCLTSGGAYYCQIAQAACNFFPKPPDPNPNRDDDYEGWFRCTRQCLQDCDNARNPGSTNSCQSNSPSWSNVTDCHAICFAVCWDERTTQNPFANQSPAH